MINFSLDPSSGLTALSRGTELQGGHYRLDQVLGTGGHGIIYLAADTHAQRPVAVKEFYPPGCSRSGSAVQVGSGAGQIGYEEAKKSFLEEIRLLGRLRHPHIVTLFTSFAENGTVYSVMENLPGETLQSIIEKRGALPESQAVGIVKQIGVALDHMHEEGILHLDVAPANVLFHGDRPVLIDFGSAREIATKKSQTTRMLVKSAILPPPGTPGFASPNHYKCHGQMSARDDVYQLGATLYYLLTGAEPTEADVRENGAVLPPPIEINRQISQAVSDAVLRAMSLDEKARPASAAAFVRSLEKVASPASPNISQAVPNPPIQALAPQPTAAPTPVYVPAPAPFNPQPPFRVQSQSGRNTPALPASRRSPNWWWVGALVVLAVFSYLRSVVQTNSSSRQPAPRSPVSTGQPAFSAPPLTASNSQRKTGNTPVPTVSSATAPAKPVRAPATTRRDRKKAAVTYNNGERTRVVRAQESSSAPERRETRPYRSIRERARSVASDTRTERGDIKSAAEREPAKPIRQREEKRSVRFEADLPPSDSTSSVRAEADLPP